MEENMPQNQNRQVPPCPPFVRPNLKKPEDEISTIQETNGQINKNTKTKKASRLNPQAKLVMISMFSAFCFAGAIALIVLMFIL